MDVIELQELLQTLGIDPEYVDELVQHTLISQPLSESGDEPLFPAAVVGEIQHIQGLKSLGYSLSDIAKILKVTDQKKAAKPQRARFYTVGQVASLLNLTKRTLDFWVEKGVIKPSSTSKSGYRLFSEDAVRVISFVKDLQTIGFTLEQIKSVTDTLNENFTPTGPETASAISLMQQKISDNEKSIKSLKAALKTIQKHARGLKIPHENLEKLDEEENN